jgi:hypothetical protein
MPANGNQPCRATLTSVDTKGAVVSRAHPGRFAATATLVLALAGAVATVAACGSTSEPRTGISGSVRDWGAFGAAAKLFGPVADTPADTHVWICVLSGAVEGWSSLTASRDLSRGGFVAYELRASTLERLATRSAAKKWRLLDWARLGSWSGTSIRPLF